MENVVDFSYLELLCVCGIGKIVLWYVVCVLNVALISFVSFVIDVGRNTHTASVTFNLILLH